MALKKYIIKPRTSHKLSMKKEQKQLFSFMECTTKNPIVQTQNFEEYTKMPNQEIHIHLSIN